VAAGRRRVRIRLRYVALALVLGFGARAVCVPAPALPDMARAPALTPGIADPAQALTFARLAGSDGVLLVTGLGTGVARAIDLSGRADPPPASPAEAIAIFGRDGLAAMAVSGRGTVEVPLAALAPAWDGGAQVAAAANFPGLGDSADPVVLFPRDATPLPARARIEAGADARFDYGVELCLTWDRPVTADTLPDAAPALFLCGGLIDGATESRVAGPFLVMPADLQAFVAGERIVTTLDGAVRQDADGGWMREGFATLAGRATAGGKAIGSLSSGTPEGVAWVPPDARGVACASAAWLCLGGWMSKTRADAVDTRHRARLEAAGRWARQGQAVEYLSSRLGVIRVEIVAPGAGTEVLPGA
jgi:hypothetical protein